MPSAPKFGRMRTGRKSYRERIESANAGDRFYAAMAGKPPQAQTVLAPKREHVKGDGTDTEAPVNAAIAEMLARHPGVRFACRFNSGAATGGDSYVRFHYVLRSPVPVRIVDFGGLLVDGRPFAIEGKKPSWSRPTDQREREQAAYIEMVIGLCGVGGFARSIEEARHIIEGQ